MKNEIEVYDNFFTKEEHKKIWELLNKPKWSLTGGGNGVKDAQKFWHIDGLETEHYFSTYLYNKICSKVNKKFRGFSRIYANGQTGGQSGSPHFDDGDITFLYYPNLEWQVQWGGHFIILDTPNKLDRYGKPQTSLFNPSPNDEIEEIVTYKPNRAVLFPATLWHYATAPHINFKGLRISLAYKLFY